MNERPVMLVTGASKGIGLGLAKHFVLLGYTVCGCSRGPAAWESDHYHHTALDVSDEPSVRKWIFQARKRANRIDALVCNAAFVPAPQLLSMTESDVWHQTMKTNLDGAFFACREAAKVMTAQRCGRIITVSSMAAALHIEGTAPYSASKSAIVEMTKVLARELASAGVTCNTVGVSMVMTDAVDGLGDRAVKSALEQLTIKRPLRIEEVCHVVEFFCSPASASVTGQVIQLGLVT